MSNGQRDQTRRKDLVELQTAFGRPSTMRHYRQAVQTLTELALQTDGRAEGQRTLVENPASSPPPSRPYH
jgi:hypothetical protein